MKRINKNNRGYLIQNMNVIMHLYLLTPPLFAVKLNLSDRTRLQEVLFGRLNPNKEQIEALIKFTGLPLDILISHKLTLELKINNLKY